MTVMATVPKTARPKAANETIIKKNRPLDFE